MLNILFFSNSLTETDININLIKFLNGDSLQKRSINGFKIILHK